MKESKTNAIVLSGIDEYIKQNQQACKMLKKYTNEI